MCVVWPSIQLREAHSGTLCQHTTYPICALFSTTGPVAASKDHKDTKDWIPTSTLWTTGPMVAPKEHRDSREWNMPQSMLSTGLSLSTVACRSPSPKDPRDPPISPPLRSPSQESSPPASRSGAGVLAPVPALPSTAAATRDHREAKDVAAQARLVAGGRLLPAKIVATPSSGTLAGCFYREQNAHPACTLMDPRYLKGEYKERGNMGTLGRKTVPQS